MEPGKGPDLNQIPVPYASLERDYYITLISFLTCTLPLLWATNFQIHKAYCTTAQMIVP
jgi:hypothetical protein